MGSSIIAVVNAFFGAELACCTEKVDGESFPPSNPMTAARVMIVAFVGFVGAFVQSALGPDQAVLSGVIAALVVTWFTFLPSFIFILSSTNSSTLFHFYSSLVNLLLYRKLKNCLFIAKEILSSITIISRYCKLQNIKRIKCIYS